MTDQRTPDEPSLPATDTEQIIPPEQPPMDDAAGPNEDTDDLTVQGGE